MPENQIKIAIFALSASQRDYLRNCLTGSSATVLCFETEAMIFDNFRYLLPRIVIARTDSVAVVWRFIFAIHTIKADSTLLIISDVLDIHSFDLKGISVAIQCLSSNSNGVGLTQVVGRILQKPPAVSTKRWPPLLVGQSDEIKRVRSMLPSLIQSFDPVLIYGEDGTGKELLARLIFANRPASFVKVNCAELIPEMVARLRMTGELFRSCQYDGGGKKTVGSFVFLLDKIDQLPPRTQSEILLLLEGISKYDTYQMEAVIDPLRIIATCEEDLKTLVAKGQFRKDLFYRLNVIPIYLPPLRRHKADISLLIDYFIIDACSRTRRSCVLPSDQTRECLNYYDWPGNISELKNLMYRMVVAEDESFITSGYLALSSRNESKDALKVWQTLACGALPEPVELKKYLPKAHNYSLKSICETFVSQTEKRMLKKALESTNWNRKKAAQLLNISYKSMLNKIKSYDIV